MADEFSSVQRTFPKKATFSNNSTFKKGKWRRGREKYSQFISDGNNGGPSNDAVGVKLKQQSKSGKTKKNKRRVPYTAKNEGKEAEESLIGEECDSSTCISVENMKAVAQPSGNFQPSRVSSTFDEGKSNIRFRYIRKSEVEVKDDKFVPSNSTGQELDRHSSDEDKVTSPGSRNPTGNAMISSASEDEASALENTEFREEIAKIPLGKAKQLRERLGKKLFDRAFFDGDSLSSRSMKSTQGVFSRKNPKRPREVSSKRPVSKFRNVFENEKLERTVCDPRFDSRCGEFDDYIYHNNYSFLDEIRQREKKILMKELKNAPEDGLVNRDRLKEALRKMKNQEKTQADVNRRKEVIREIRHENNERMRQGLPPVFKTRAQIRELIWRKKYEELKGGDKLKKYLRRKMKKQDKKRSGFGGSISCHDEPPSFPSE